MAGVQILDVNLRIANEDEVASQISGLVRKGGEEGGKKGKSGSNQTGLGQSIATGAATAVFGRIADAIKNLESSIGSAFDASTSAAEKQASVLEGLGATISPALAAAVRGAVGPQVETEQQTISRVLGQLQSAAEAISLAQGPGASQADIRTAVGTRLDTQINALSDMERRRAQGSVALQQILAVRSQGLDAGQVLQQAAGNGKGAASAAGIDNPLLNAALSAFGTAAEDQKTAAKEIKEAAEVMRESVQATTAGPSASASLGLDGSE